MIYSLISRSSTLIFHADPFLFSFLILYKALLYELYKRCDFYFIFLLFFSVRRWGEGGGLNIWLGLLMQSECLVWGGGRWAGEQRAASPSGALALGQRGQESFYCTHSSTRQSALRCAFPTSSPPSISGSPFIFSLLFIYFSFVASPYFSPRCLKRLLRRAHCSVLKCESGNILKEWLTSCSYVIPGCSWSDREMAHILRRTCHMCRWCQKRDA